MALDIRTASEHAMNPGGAGAATATPGKRTLVEAARADRRTLSGAAWCAKYPTGKTIADLRDASFKADVQAFHDAMVAAATPANALHISISATYRPIERAHLMHYCYNVHSGAVSVAAANAASAAAGIAINWDHGNDATSRAKAGEMVTGYAIAFAPALVSRHTEGKAIDWNLTWTGSLRIAKKGESHKLDCTGTGTSSANLHAVGASYGVHKLATDPPHWSSDGH
ncbi:MAG TPA: hypothetical protein VFP84_36355 [Kofleriaceae bacterium]|nr:hypothetical protein [Kofleriaceae bacterium]